LIVYVNDSAFDDSSFLKGRSVVPLFNVEVVDLVLLGFVCEFNFNQESV
jgi:hypothetical protein